MPGNNQLSQDRASAGVTGVSFRFLAANQQVDFHTISDFRKNKLARLQGVFVEALHLCQSVGLTKMSR